VFVTVLALLASGVFLARLLPQPVRLARQGIDAGVAPLAAMNALVAAVAWLVYGWAADLPVVWVVSLLACVPGVWTVLLLGHKITGRDLVASALWVAVLVAAWFGGAFGAALGAGVLVTQGPQVLAALREDDLRGIAPMTWRLSLADAIVWGAYGWALGDPALLGYFVVLAVSSMIVLVRLRQTAPAGLALQPA
jgi:uncharacterized protein with PQ loop repeat